MDWHIPHESSKYFDNPSRGVTNTTNIFMHNCMFGNIAINLIIDNE